VCSSALCMICGRRLAVSTCPLCGRLMCVECSVQLDAPVRVCVECFRRNSHLGRRGLLALLREPRGMDEAARLALRVIPTPGRVT